MPKYLVDCTSSIWSHVSLYGHHHEPGIALPINMTTNLVALMLSLFDMYRGIIELRTPCYLFNMFSKFDPNA